MIIIIIGMYMWHTCAVTYWYACHINPNGIHNFQKLWLCFVNFRHLWLTVPDSRLCYM